MTFNINLVSYEMQDNQIMWVKPSHLLTNTALGGYHYLKLVLEIQDMTQDYFYILHDGRNQYVSAMGTCIQMDQKEKFQFKFRGNVLNIQEIAELQALSQCFFQNTGMEK